MEYNLEAIRMQQACLNLASEIAPRFGPVAARDMNRLWEEHISERDAVSLVLERWAPTLRVTHERDAVFRQIFIRLLGVEYLMSQYLDGLSECEVFDQLQDPASQFRHLAIQDWTTDHWPKEWFLILGARQMNILPE